MKLLRLALAAFVVLVACGAFAQSEQQQIPPGLMRAQRADERSRADMPPPLSPHRTLSPEQLRRDAAELSRLALQIQTEVQALNKGILNKNLDGELKQLEKLSKKLRQEVRPD